MINPNTTTSIEAVTWALTHESMHAVIDLEWKKGLFADYPGTLYEETIAFRFQLSVGREIGFDPGPIVGFSRSAEQRTNYILRRSLRIDLSEPPSERELYYAYKRTYYNGKLGAIPRTEYNGIMETVINTFIQ
jgi:hypothetical protein